MTHFHTLLRTGETIEHENHDGTREFAHSHTPKGTVRPPYTRETLVLDRCLTPGEQGDMTSNATYL